MCCRALARGGCARRSCWRDCRCRCRRRGRERRQENQATSSGEDFNRRKCVKWLLCVCSSGAVRCGGVLAASLPSLSTHELVGRSTCQSRFGPTAAGIVLTHAPCHAFRYTYLVRLCAPLAWCLVWLRACARAGAGVDGAASHRHRTGRQPASPLPHPAAHPHLQLQPTPLHSAQRSATGTTRDEKECVRVKSTHRHGGDDGDGTRRQAAAPSWTRRHCIEHRHQMHAHTPHGLTSHAFLSPYYFPLPLLCALSPLLSPFLSSFLPLSSPVPSGRARPVVRGVGSARPIRPESLAQLPRVQVRHRYV